MAVQARPHVATPQIAAAGPLLAQAGRAAVRLLTEALRPVGLKPRDLAILEALRGGPLTQQALGEHMGIDPALVVALLNALEADGLALRRRDPADRRRHIVEISPLGCTRLRAADAAIAAVDDRLFGRLEPAEREMLAGTLRRAIENAGTPEPCASAESDACEDAPCEGAGDGC